MKQNRALNERKPLSLWGYIQGIWLVTLLTVFSYILQPFFSTTGIVMLYLLGVVVSAVLWGLGPSILVCILCVLVHDFFFVNPALRFGPIDIRDIPTLIALIAVGATISYLASRVRQHAEEAIHRERETYHLYVLSRSLASTDDLEASARAIVGSASEALECNALLFLPDPWRGGVLKPYGGSAQPAVGEDGNAAAAWSLQHQIRAGRGTAMFPDAGAKYVPLLTSQGAVGVLAITGIEPSSDLTAGQERLLDVFADVVAVALERIALAQRARDMEVFQAATEKLQTALLDSISHEMRTPLTSVIGVLSSLQQEFGLDDATKKNLVQVASKEAERLSNSITNLLDLSRIQAGAISIDRQPCDVRDIISVALDQMGDRANGRSITVDAGVELSSVSVDFGLIVKVLLNLVDNAIKYSPPESPVEISARLIAREVEIEVADRGIGIPPQELPYIFQRFHRIPNTVLPGMGLGLSICKGIVEAHGGRIAAENRPGGGTIVRLTLPVAEATAEKKGQTG